MCFGCKSDPRMMIFGVCEIIHFISLKSQCENLSTRYKLGRVGNYELYYIAAIYGLNLIVIFEFILSKLFQTIFTYSIEYLSAFCIAFEYSRKIAYNMQTVLQQNYSNKGEQERKNVYTMLIYATARTQCFVIIFFISRMSQLHDRIQCECINSNNIIVYTKELAKEHCFSKNYITAC